MEAEGLLVDAARWVAAAVAGPAPAREVGWPEEQRRRLELLVLAVFGFERIAAGRRVEERAIIG